MSNGRQILWTCIWKWWAFSVLLSWNVSQLACAEANQNVDALAIAEVNASSEQAGYSSRGAIDGSRLSVAPGRLWKGVAGAGPWYWEADFGKQVQIGCLLQVLGDDENVLSSAPLSYVWQVRDDGQSEWKDIPATRITNEQRLYRIHRFGEVVNARFLRLLITQTGGEPPAVREIEAYVDPRQKIDFPDWFFVASSEESGRISTCHQFLDLARRCRGRESIQAQYIWHGVFDESVALAEPKPMCIFYTGSFSDWCEVDPSTWKGTQELLQNGSIPMWGACGGCQAFGILSAVGYDSPWDCPKCRDPESPKLPIYGHIGLKDPSVLTTCGDYSNNVYEIGPTPVRIVRDDPVFAGLPQEFLVPENHCGQLEYVPEGWQLLVTNGEGGKTRMQCMRKIGTCIYAAQFHIELDGTPDISTQIMSNFLNYAQQWGSIQHSSARAVSEKASVESSIE